MNIRKLFNPRAWVVSCAIAAMSTFLFSATEAVAKCPLKIGFSMALTGGLAGGGKQALVAMEM